MTESTMVEQGCERLREDLEGRGRVRQLLGRVDALDVARGWLLVLSLTSISVIRDRPSWMEHAEWTGITYEDLIFPMFVVLAGCGLAFAYKNGVSAGNTLRRVVVLLLAGLIYNALTESTRVDLATFWVTGPLQVYAVIVLVLALAHLVLRVPLAWAIGSLVVAGLWGYWIWKFQQGCPAGLTKECNPSRVVDWAVFKNHMYDKGTSGHDPVGIIASMGAVITASIGCTSGHLFSWLRRRPWVLCMALLAWAATGFFFGRWMSLHIPAFKRLWTPSFALITGALGVALLFLAFALIDLPSRTRLRPVINVLKWPFVALGRNSLLVYFGSHVVTVLLIRSTGHAPGVTMADDLAHKLSLHGSPQLGLTVTTVAFWWVLAMILHSRRVYVHA